MKTPSPLCQAMTWALTVFVLTWQRKMRYHRDHILIWYWRQKDKYPGRLCSRNRWSRGPWWSPITSNSVFSAFKERLSWGCQKPGVCVQCLDLQLSVGDGRSGLLSNESWIIFLFSFLRASTHDHQPCSEKLQMLVPSNGDFDWVHFPSFVTEPFTLLNT